MPSEAIIKEAFAGELIEVMELCSDFIEGSQPRDVVLGDIEKTALLEILDEKIKYLIAIFYPDYAAVIYGEEELRAVSWRSGEVPPSKNSFNSIKNVSLVLQATSPAYTKKAPVNTLTVKASDGTEFEINPEDFGIEY